MSHSAFMHAMEATQNPSMRAPGLQEFAAAIWERRRRIPSQTYNDPLQHIFTEFDHDSDGHLTAAEVAAALSSRGVQVTEAQVQMYIEAVDNNNNHTVERGEFADLIFSMATASLTSGSFSSVDLAATQASVDAQ